ncbi:MAG: signal peptidase II [Eubacteriales bacterium]
MKAFWNKCVSACKEYFTHALPAGFRRRWYFLLIALGVIGIDQLTKQIVASQMALHEKITVIPHVFSFYYITNDGAAWGMLDEHPWVFMLLSTVGIIALTLYLLGKKDSDGWIDTAIALVIGGGIGNMIDRIAYGEVIDFLNADFLDPLGGFPVFNGADSFVCVGAAILFVVLLIRFIAAFVKDGKKKKADAAEGADAEVQEEKGHDSDSDA